MKKLLLAAALLCAAIANATTTIPLPLISPTGSTSGQFITSSGPTTAPAWTSVTLSGLGGLAKSNNLSDVASVSTARTNLGAAATASPLSQFAATTSAQLASVISDETGSGALVFGTSPTIATPAITGVTSGASAAAGSVGEVISPIVPTAFSITTNVATNINSAPLTPGIWLVYGQAKFVPAGTTVVQLYQGGISTTSATFGAVGTFFQNVPATTAGSFGAYPMGPVLINVTTNTTVFLVGLTLFTTSTMTVTGSIMAVRIH